MTIERRSFHPCIVLHHPLVKGSVLACMLTGAGGVSADTDKTLQLVARYEQLHDSNLFRLSSTLPASTLGGRPWSDTIRIGSAGLLLDKSYSLQRIELNASLVNYKYQNYDYLNFTALNYAAAWHWSITPRLRGTLQATQRQNSNSFSDTQDVTQRNVRTDSVLRAQGEYDMGAAVKLFGSVDQFRLRNEELLAQDRGFKVQSVAGGVRYVLPSGSQLSYRLRKGHGEYSEEATVTTTPLPTTFNNTEHELTARWVATGKTTLYARVAHVSRQYPGFAGSDFSGPVGGLRLSWQPTAKLRLDATADRDWRSYQTQYSSYASGNRFTLTPSWQATAHTSLRMHLEQYDEDYGGAIDRANFPFDRADTTRSASLGLDWRPRDSITLGFWLKTEKRVSNYSGFDFKNNSANFSAQISY
ncbi:XrtB/PEP-CTERM-associated polysaccharide biosynthesis outer membrane protein EpsL [Pseudorhodoferax sp. Leaf274]|uniref:XrtB/PEP-CTERM-associated polysaccharide biosynthesis outer membrane protein EpsL n=1 Tax=Pseudorhodoferax sp. Leaf274 TaxID=1736318 RepID=UPI000703B5DA|nr:XrtB/PEP-CTERM-associated polysaccharide biosynthesis outer membrane protein EpsL [Pseudorhodoferax sp. Leaf274]KQP43211.1 hypothetical protein ASF44_06490 [Pseudorhodoferax sp. Leaf274]